MEIHHLLLFRQGGNPVHILVGGKGIFRPFGVVEIHRNVVAQLVVGKQNFELGCCGGVIDIVGRFPSQYMLRTHCQTGLEPHPVDQHGDIIVVDQFGVGEGLGLYAEGLIYGLGLKFHLADELFRIFERRQGVGEGACQKFDTSRLGKLAKLIHTLRHIELQLL